jgi:hypothetical protein
MVHSPWVNNKEKSYVFQMLLYTDNSGYNIDVLLFQLVDAAGIFPVPGNMEDTKARCNNPHHSGD